MNFAIAEKIRPVCRKLEEEYNKRLKERQKINPGLQADSSIIEDIFSEMKLESKLTKEELIGMLNHYIFEYVGERDSYQKLHQMREKDLEFTNFLLYAVKHNIKIVWEK